MRYRSIVRQHVDLEMVRAKLDRVEPGRSYATSEFFRDLLLLCGNATVFYPKDSPEFAAAVHLRRLVTKEMATTVLTPTEPTPQPPPPPPPPEPKPTASKSETEPDLSSGLVDKPNSSPLLIACRKRSSTSNKPAVAAVEKEEKSDPARIESDNEEKSLPKKTTKERSVRSGRTRGWRTSKVRGGNGEGSPAAKRSNVAPSPCLKSKPVENVAAVGEAARPDKKNTGGGAATCAASTAKKQGSTGFLKRMKRNPKGTVEEMPKSSSGGVSGGGSGRGTEQKKEAKCGARKEQGSRQGSTGGGGSGGSGKKVAETSGGSAKRGVGRPPKRAREEAEIAAPSKAPASASRKRRRM